MFLLSKLQKLKNKEVNHLGYSQIVVLLSFLAVLLIGGVIYYRQIPPSQKVVQIQNQQTASQSPQVNTTSQPQKEVSYKIQKIGDLSFQYPADWQGGVDSEVSYIPLKSPDVSTAMGGVLSSGMQVTAEYLDKQSTFFADGTGSTSFQTLDQFETNIKTSNLYQDIKRTKISSLDALSFSKQLQAQAGSNLKTYYLVILKGEKVLTMQCTYNLSNAPANADAICSKIVNSLAQN